MIRNNPYNNRLSDLWFSSRVGLPFTSIVYCAASKPNTVDLLSLEGHNNNTRQHTWRLDQWQCGDCLPDTDTCTRTTQAAGGLSHTILLPSFHFPCFQTSIGSLTMACSAIYFLDSKGKVLLCRNYRGDIDNTVIDNFISE